MNIDSFNLHSLFSSVEGLEKLQHSLQTEGLVSQEFAETLLEKIKQLTGLDEVDYLSENFVAGSQQNVNRLHEVSALFGKDLPLSKLENEIDLENTLDALTNVMSAIKDVVSEELVLDDNKLVTEQLESVAIELDENREAVIAVDKEVVNNKAIDNNLQTSLPEDEIELLASQISMLVALHNAPMEKEIVTGNTFQQVKPEIKNDIYSLKQITEEKTLGTSSKAESDTLLQQENAFTKSRQDEKIAFLEIKHEINNEKALPKFATDIAMLNRAVISENKAELLPMNKHFAHPEWKNEFSERIIWMHKQAVPSAELRLNPAHLGPITIKVDVTQDQASVAFIAQHAAVKDAIEAAIPKLKEMFTTQQLNLVDVNISQGDTGQRQSKAFTQMGEGQGRNNNKNEEEMANSEQTENLMGIADEIEAGRAIASNGILSIFA
jgi:flagellar hook-length control protein FliK